VRFPDAGYASVGTVEFLVTPNNQHTSSKVNTRLQVEHPGTEIVTGVDLVKEPILVAGEELSYEEGELLTRGWAIECRIVAGTRSTTSSFGGRVVLAREPAGPGIRVESALFDVWRSLPTTIHCSRRSPPGERARRRAQPHEAPTFRVSGRRVATNIPYLLQILDSRTSSKDASTRASSIRTPSCREPSRSRRRRPRLPRCCW